MRKYYFVLVLLAFSLTGCMDIKLYSWTGEFRSASESLTLRTSTDSYSLSNKGQYALSFQDIRRTQNGGWELTEDGQTLTSDDGIGLVIESMETNESFIVFIGDHDDDHLRSSLFDWTTNDIRMFDFPPEQTGLNYHVSITASRDSLTEKNAYKLGIYFFNPGTNALRGWILGQKNW